MSSEGANLFNEGYRGWPHPTVKVEPTPSRRARSPHASMPLACQSQQSRPVSSGQPRTTALPPRPALVLVLAGAEPGRSGFGSKESTLPTQLSNYHKLRKPEHTDERSPQKPQR